jgi:hypothetical protein
VDCNVFEVVTVSNGKEDCDDVIRGRVADRFVCKELGECFSASAVSGAAGNR